MPLQKLSAVALKDVLWQTLNDVRENHLDPAAADSVATQAREILRTVKTQQQILHQAKKGVTRELYEFAAPPTEL